MGKTRKKKQLQREQKRQEAKIFGHNGEVMIFSETDVAPDHLTPGPIERAHYELDEWIRGKIEPGLADAVPASLQGNGVIWLGKLQKTMVDAREFYRTHAEIINAKKTQFQSKTAGKRPEPRRTPTDVASVQMENRRGEWVPSIPLPFYGLKKRCSCGAKFWRARNYEAHYALEHIVLGVQPL